MILAYLHPGWVPHEFMQSVMAFRNWNPSSPIYSLKSGPGIARKRNQVAASFLQTRDDWLLWVDADMVFGPEHVVRLLQAGRMFVAANCVRVHENGDTALAAVVRTPDGRMTPLTHPSEKVQKVAAVGMAFTLIHRSVYEATGVDVGVPHLERVVDGVHVGEDVGMCLRAAEAGFDPYVATEVRVGHIKPKVYYP